jgi:hypothetical protein
MGTSTIGARRERVSRSAGGDLGHELETALRAQVKESPFLTLAAAGGLGFVLGGGLTIGVMARLLRAGVRIAFTIRAKETLIDWLATGRRPETTVQLANMGDTK